MDRLTGKVALVTGAAQGIGRALCQGLADEGAMVLAADVNRQGAMETAQQIMAASGQAKHLHFDVAKSAQVAEVFSAVDQHFGRLDILVNNAAIFPRSPVLEMDEHEWDEVIAVNLTGTFLCAQAAARYFVAQAQGGRIVNLTSGAAFVASANGAHYAASKGGIVALTKALAVELAPFGVTVNAIAPGFTDTPQPRLAYSEEDLRTIARRIPLGRIAQPEDIISTVNFLCSDAAGYMTGQTLHVNGGLYMA